MNCPLVVVINLIYTHTYLQRPETFETGGLLFRDTSQQAVVRHGSSKTGKGRHVYFYQNLGRLSLL